MHRQSLSLPSVKRHSHGGAKEETDSVSPASIYYDQEDDDAGKSRPASSPPPTSVKFIHLLPTLIFFCFLVLYLCSHTPSASEMASVHRFKRPFKNSDSSVDSNSTRRVPAEEADILPIRTVENLQETRPHRKFADS